MHMGMRSTAAWDWCGLGDVVDWGHSAGELAEAERMNPMKSREMRLLCSVLVAGLWLVTGCGQKEVAEPEMCILESIEEDVQAGLPDLRQRAEAGDVEAQMELGDLLAHGLFGVEQNPSEGEMWYRRAAAQGSAEAQESLGMMFFFGTGVEQNFAEAEKWFQACKGTSVTACWGLGQIYYLGLGVEPNFEAAKRYLQQAKDAGFPEAMEEIEDWEWQPEGGVATMRKAADQGDTKAMKALGALYLYGLGVEKSPAEAKVWFQKAADAGDEEAKKHLRSIRFLEAIERKP